MSQVQTGPVTRRTLFHQRLREFIASCAASPAEEEIALIREAARIFHYPPAGAVPVEGEGAARPCLETLLRVGGAMSGVLGLIGDDTPFMCSRGIAGTCLAIVVVDEGCEDITAEGATPVLALLGALAASRLAQSEAQWQMPQPVGRSLRLH